MRFDRVGVIDRRQFSAGVLLTAFAVSAPAVAATHAARRSILNALKQLEIKSQGRLGVHMIAPNGQEFGYRSDELFMMLSSFKTLASAFVLARVDSGAEKLDRRIRYGQQDLMDWSPVTKDHADGEGLTLAELCHAAVTTSDNTAANLILNSFGGPRALTRFIRQTGDRVTRLDRIEPELNVSHGTEPLDTTSPRAMVHTLKRLLAPGILSDGSRRQLQQWLMSNTTGGKRLKAGLPAGWTIGDKTGTNQSDANDVGVLFPPHGAPIHVSAYLAESTASSAIKEQTLAEVGRIAATLAG